MSKAKDALRDELITLMRGYVPPQSLEDCKFRENDDFCTGRGFPYQLVPDYGFCDKGERAE